MHTSARRSSQRRDVDTSSGHMALWRLLRSCTSPACGKRYEDGGMSQAAVGAARRRNRDERSPRVRAGRSTAASLEGHETNLSAVRCRYTVVQGEEPCLGRTPDELRTLSSASGAYWMAVESPDRSRHHRCTGRCLLLSGS